MRRLGALDSLFLALESADHPLHTMAVLVLDPATIPDGYDFGRMRAFVASRLPAIPPLRRRLVGVPFGIGRPSWVEADVEIAKHVHRVQLDRVSLAHVMRFAAALDEQPLDRSRPLWDMYFVEGLDDGSVALVAKVHHALMDGVGGMEFMANMFSTDPEPAPVVPVVIAPERMPRPIEMFARGLPDVAAIPFRATRALIESARGLWRSRLAIGRGASIGAPRVRWNDPLSARRSATITELPLADVKAVAHATEATVNDVILSVLGGACREYLGERNQLPETSLVAAVPVSLHDAGVTDYTNAVSLLFTKIGTDIEEPAARLAAVHEAAINAKRLHEAVGGDTLTSWLAVAGPLLFSTVSRIYLELGLTAYTPPLVDLLISNVPGPPVALYFGGARLRGLYPLGPIYDGIGLNVTVVSSADTIGFGFVTCPDVLADVDALATGVRTAFDALRAETIPATATSRPA